MELINTTVVKTQNLGNGSFLAVLVTIEWKYNYSYDLVRYFSKFIFFC